AVAAREIAVSVKSHVDLGSGGGSPALPLQILRPDLKTTLVEATAKKAAFLGEAVGILELKNVSVKAARFEDLAAETAEPYADLVTTRAVRADTALFDAAGKLLVPSGQLWIFDSGRSASN